MSRAVGVRPSIGDFKREKTLSPLAGKPAPKELLVDVAQLERAYFERHPDIADPNQLIRFGTSGHRGTPLDGTFTEAHVLAITQAICDYRTSHGLDGPLYLGKDTHALSVPSQRTAIEVLAGNNVETILQKDDDATPTPVISRAILTYNWGRKNHLADGIVITPSHNPQRDGGFNAGVNCVPFRAAMKAATKRGAAHRG
jgi:phosphoglucomutase